MPDASSRALTVAVLALRQNVVPLIPQLSKVQRAGSLNLRRCKSLREIEGHPTGGVSDIKSDSELGGLSYRRGRQPSGENDPESGRLVPPESPFALAETIIELLNDSRACSVVSRAARQKFEKKFLQPAAANY